LCIKIREENLPGDRRKKNGHFRGGLTNGGRSRYLQNTGKKEE